MLHWLVVGAVCRRDCGVAAVRDLEVESMSHRMSVVVAVALLVVLASSPILAGPGVVSLTAYADPAEINIGYRWMIDGDENLNARCTVRYRAQGDIEWSPGLDGWRFHPWITPSEDSTGGVDNVIDKAENRFAGSVFWVDPRSEERRVGKECR